MKDIDFSIIIPIFNASHFLRECLDSVVNQTYQNIEIICVDDASSDESMEILKQYAIQDERIHIIAKSVNGGTSKARKDGVLCSSGKHVLFLDADDKLMEYACERLHAIDELNSADIIQFDVYVKADNEIDSSKVNELEHYLQPCYREISIEEVQKLCFNVGSLSHSLWGKMFDGSICRKAFEYLADDNLVMAEDLYAYFAISVFSETYSGISDKLYQYNYGDGITGRGKEFSESFAVNCGQLPIALKCQEFVEKIGKKEEYADIVEGIRKYLMKVFINYWINHEKRICEKEIAVIQEILSNNCSKEDLGYMSAFLGMYCQHYKQARQDCGWIFPYHSVPKKSRIIIYGAGAIGKDYYSQIVETEYCIIVAWVDKAYDRFKNSEKAILSPEIINSIEYDYVIIAIKDSLIQGEVKEYLLNLNVKEDSILQI